MSVCSRPLACLAAAFALRLWVASAEVTFLGKREPSGSPPGVDELESRRFVFGDVTASSGEEGPSGSQVVVTNGCDTAPVWIASVIPEEWRSRYPSNLKLEPGQSATFSFSGAEALRTRFWPKLGCNDDGSDCVLGESGGDGQAPCPPGGCAPPVDSKLEATFGDSAAGAAVDTLSLSGADGYTLPYKLELSGCPGGTDVDCSALALSDCPEVNVLSFVPRSVPTSMQVRNPAGTVVGCYSPCSKLTMPNFGNQPIYQLTQVPALLQCCPEPIDATSCANMDAGMNDYVKAFHRSCPQVSGFRGDSAPAGQTCPVGTTYHWTLFCQK